MISKLCPTQRGCRSSSAYLNNRGRASDVVETMLLSKIDVLIVEWLLLILGHAFEEEFVLLEMKLPTLQDCK